MAWTQSTIGNAASGADYAADIGAAQLWISDKVAGVAGEYEGLLITDITDDISFGNPGSAGWYWWFHGDQTGPIKRKFSSGAAIAISVTGHANTAGVQFEDLEIDCAAQTNVQNDGIQIGAAAGAAYCNIRRISIYNVQRYSFSPGNASSLCENCISHNSGAGVATGRSWYFQNGGIVRNCISAKAAGVAFTFGFFSDVTGTIENCISVGGAQGTLGLSRGIINFDSCVFYDALPVDTSNATVTCTNCAEFQTDYESYFTDWLNNDFSLKDADNNLWGINGNPATTPPEDFASTVRTSFDIGPYESEATGPVNIDFTAADITSGIPSVSSASLDVNVNLSSTHITSGIPEVSKPTVVVNVALTAADVVSGIPEVGGAVLSLVPPIDFTAADITSGIPAVPTAALMQNQPLLSGDVVSGNPEVTSAAITSEHVLQSADIASGISEVSKPLFSTESGEFLFSAADIVSGIPEVSPAEIGVTVSYMLTAADVVSGISEVTAASASQVHPFGSADIVSGIPEVPTASMLEDVVLVSADCVSGISEVEGASLDEQILLDSAEVVSGISQVSKPTISGGIPVYDLLEAEQFNATGQQYNFRFPPGITTKEEATGRAKSDADPTGFRNIGTGFLGTTLLADGADVFWDPETGTGSATRLVLCPPGQSRLYVFRTGKGWVDYPGGHKFYVVAQYAGMEIIGLAFPALTAGWEPLLPYSASTVPDLGIQTDLAAGQFSIPLEGVYYLSVSASISHNEVNSGREMRLRLFDVTQGIIGTGVMYGTGRNVGVTNLAFSTLFAIAQADAGNSYRLELGGGDSYSAVTIEDFVLSIQSVGRWTVGST